MTKLPRRIITFTKKQDDFLKRIHKESHISVSEYVRNLVEKEMKNHANAKE